MNRCDICGKFRKWDDLKYEGHIDYNGDEDEWLECNECSPHLFEDALQLECDRAYNDEFQQSLESYHNDAI